MAKQERLNLIYRNKHKPVEAKTKFITCYTASHQITQSIIYKYRYLPLADNQVAQFVTDKLSIFYWRSTFLKKVGS